MMGFCPYLRHEYSSPGMSDDAGAWDDDWDPRRRSHAPCGETARAGWLRFGFLKQWHRAAPGSAWWWCAAGAAAPEAGCLRFGRGGLPEDTAAWSAIWLSGGDSARGERGRQPRREKAARPWRARWQELLLRGERWSPSYFSLDC